jgi:hypothetical protein
MKFYTILFAIAFTLIGTFSVTAQSVEPKMTFDKEIHDFGNVNEQDGDLTHSFVFRNTGSEPIVITNVRATCGCTTPNWTNQPIAPGDKGEITAVYHVKNRPGSFNKTIIVYSNAENSPVNLRIKGNVAPKPKTIEDKYRFLVGKVRFDKTHIHFSDIYNDEVKTESLEFINISDENISLSLADNRSKPKHIDFSVSPETVAPGETGVVTIKYSAIEKNDWDYVRDYLFFNINGEYDHKNRISVSANIKERFSKSDLKNPPAIDFIDSNVYDFGTVQKGEKIEHTFRFKNTGKSDLIIRKVRASCGCTATTTGKEILKPGEESSVKTVFDTTHKRGNQRSSITMITNIPGKTGHQENARILLSLKGTVQE